MIRITVEEKEGSYRRIESRGHAGYDDSGMDIVCAAVSALLINTASSLERFTDDGLVIDEAPPGSDGYLAIKLEEPVSDRGNVLFDSLLNGLEMIRASYGNGDGKSTAEAFLSLEYIGQQQQI